MKKVLVWVLSSVLLLLMVACQSTKTQMPNPVTDCATLEEAAALAGVTFTVPETVQNGLAQQAFRAVKGDFVEVLYGEDDIRIRKAAGEGDISGDYTQYAEEQAVTVGDVQVTLKGQDGKVKLAIWSQNGSAFSVGVSADSTGITADEMTAIVAGVS